MDRVNRIWNHPLYQKELGKLQILEKHRKFCRHTPEHFLDVARLAYIEALEQAYPVSKEMIYCTALLHDIGRYEQIAHGTPHDIASAQMAQLILAETGFADTEIHQIQDAILHHRGNEATGATPLALYLYRADKQSRNCFCCPASLECNWPESKKNLEIDY